MSEADAKKAARKEKLKQEAEKLGIPYKELKEQKKAAKEKKRNHREADNLETSEHKQDMKRMRSWSKDEKDPTSAEGDAKRRRTRSMDAKESEASQDTLSPSEWRKSENITIKGHGKHMGIKADETPAPFLKFTDAPFNQTVQRCFSQAGFTKPTAIQSQAWPIAIRGDDMICIAKTGSGKTCGFLLPSIHQHLESQQSRSSRMRNPVLLVLAPTRELACQIMDETKKFGRPMGISSVCCYGGSSKFPQIAALERGVDCIIATPGRINDLLEMRKANLSNVKFLVLDEADR